MQNQVQTDKSRLTKTELAVLISAAVITITFVSTCSPLYPFNPWDDVNVFFTLGRGLIHGMIPYRDIFDHKGPLLYFIYALAALISEKSFIGAWLIECIAASVYAVFSWKITKLFTEPSRAAIAIVPLFLGLTYTNTMFNFGGNTEELCFPLLTVALYIGLKAIVCGDGLPSNKGALLCGLISGALFWLKYTFLGFMIGFCLYVLVLSLRRRAFSRLWSLIWRFIAGCFILTVPILCFFLATGSISYLWEAYFYDNIFLYNNSGQGNILTTLPVIKNIYIPLKAITVTMIKHPAYGLLMLTSLISLLFIEKKHRQKTLLLFLLTFILSAGFIFTRISFIYYYGYLLSYCFCFALIPVVKAVTGLEKIFKNNIWDCHVSYYRRGRRSA